MASVDEGETAAEASDSRHHRDKDEEESKTHPSRFRFKRKSDKDERSRSSSRHDGSERYHRHHKHYHRRKRRRLSPYPSKERSPSPDDTHLPTPSVDPEVAFRESLFDAMADDEGAEFWEGVYGQPVHTYSDVKKGPTGKLERMTDEEYTAYVRAKMYEKTHQHLVEERKRREEAKKERARLEREGRKEEEEAKRFGRRVEESLRRGEERRERKAWSERWEKYVGKWEELGKGMVGSVHVASIPWPVESGGRKDVEAKEVERFFLYAPTEGQPTEMALRKVLKTERVRWHPDKIQQKLGGQDVWDDVLRGVTEVFQIIDRMWAEIRDQKK